MDMFAFWETVAHSFSFPRLPCSDMFITTQSDTHDLLPSKPADVPELVQTKN
jgi:hypothetical protein